MNLYKVKATISFNYHLVTDRTLQHIGRTPMGSSINLALNQFIKNGHHYNDAFTQYVVDKISWDSKLDFYYCVDNNKSFPITIENGVAFHKKDKTLEDLKNENSGIILKDGKRYKLVPLDEGEV